jgi:hypothetical protein
MPRRKIKLLDTVALLEDLPERKLKHGEVGTVVEVLAPDVYEVEFCDDEGQTYAELALRSDQLMVLHAPCAAGIDASVRIFNNDGSESGACGPFEVEDCSGGRSAVSRTSKGTSSWRESRNQLGSHSHFYPRGPRNPLAVDPAKSLHNRKLPLNSPFFLPKNKS